MVSERPGLFGLAVVCIIMVGLSPGLDSDFPCPVGVNTLGEAFMVAIPCLRVHTFSAYSLLSILKVHDVLFEMVNRQIGCWVSERKRAAQHSFSFVAPPRAGTGFDFPPLRKLVRALEIRRESGGNAQARAQQCVWR